MFQPHSGIFLSFNRPWLPCYIASTMTNASNQPKKKIANELEVLRTGRGLSRKAVARLLGYKKATPVIRFEKGERLPSLTKALQLEIIYRIPVAFLYPDLYVSLRDEIRAAEERQGKQLTLF